MMPDPQLDITPLHKAIERLEEGLLRFRQNVQDAQLRDGLVQRLEFTYGISHKMLLRYLKATAGSPGEYEQMPFQDLVRSGNRQGLLQGDWPAWRGYREMRSKTGHTYDEAVAFEVVAGIPDFLNEARYLASTLQDRVA